MRLFPSEPNVYFHGLYYDIIFMKRISLIEKLNRENYEKWNLKEIKFDEKNKEIEQTPL